MCRMWTLQSNTLKFCNLPWCIIISLFELFDTTLWKFAILSDNFNNKKKERKRKQKNMKQSLQIPPPAYGPVPVQNENDRPTYFDIVGRLKITKAESTSFCEYIVNSLRILYGSCNNNFKLLQFLTETFDYKYYLLRYFNIFANHLLRLGYCNDLHWIDLSKWLHCSR